MYTLKNVAIAALIILISASSIKAQYYYYSDNREIPLTIDSTKLLIKPDLYNWNSDDFIQDYERIDSVIGLNPNYDGYMVILDQDPNWRSGDVVRRRS